MATHTKRIPDSKQMRITTFYYHGGHSYSGLTQTEPKLTVTWANQERGSYYNKNEVKIDLSPEVAKQVFAMIQADTAAQLRQMFPEFTPEEVVFASGEKSVPAA